MQRRRSQSEQNATLKRGVVSLVLLLGAASCVPAQMAGRPAAASESGIAAAIAALPPPPPEPLMLQPVGPADAQALNAAMPLADIHNPPARAFSISHRGMIDRMRSVDCLTSAIYYEAASESDDGQRAVAQVVLNRVRHPSYPNSVCGVVYQGSERTTGCQFTFTCDGSLLRTPSVAGWARARRIAAAALSGQVFAPVGHATHYHTNQVLPYWASSLVKSAVIGAHIFYRWSGHWGEPAAFRQAYAGAEPLPGPKPRIAAPLPLPSPNMKLLSMELGAVTASSTPASAPQYSYAAAVAPPADDRLPKVVYSGSGLPESKVRDAYLHSGVPRDELPAAVAASGR